MDRGRVVSTVSSRIGVCVWQHCRASNGSGMVKSIGPVGLSEEPTHGVSSQDLVAAMRS
jgi:hypothetical protein